MIKFKAFFVKEVTTIEGILKSWFEKVEQLEQHAVAKAQQAAQHEITISQVTVAKDAAEAEAKAAADIAAKIKAVIS